MDVFLLEVLDILVVFIFALFGTYFFGAFNVVFPKNDTIKFDGMPIVSSLSFFANLDIGDTESETFFTLGIGKHRGCGRRCSDTESGCWRSTRTTMYVAQRRF